ncbi:S8 family serine peptidase [bacterium]|nr:S8 family serine peptidase [bacterium]
MRQMFALLMLPFLLMAAGGPLIDGNVVPTSTYLYENPSVINLPCGIKLDTRDAKPSLPSNLMIAGEQQGTGTYLVHFDGPIYTHERRALEQQGVIIDGYLPNYTYIVRMEKSALNDVKQVSGVDWVGDYQPGYKICPDFNLSDKAPQKLVVVLYAGTDAEVIRSTVESLGGTMLEWQSSEWSTLVHINLAPEKIPGLVTIPDVKWVEPFRVMYLHNGQAQWVMQTWDDGNRKIWDKGIKGQGQIGSTLDSGIRTSHNFFRDPSKAITDFGDFPTHRKIIAYQKPAVDDPDNPVISFGDENGHGTHTAGSMLGNDVPAGGSSPNIGMAPEAKIFFLDGGGSSGGIIHAVSLEYSLSLPYNGNSAGGARVISNSWGNQTTRAYDASCKEADQTMWNRSDYLVCFSAGNTDQGPYTGSPGNAKDVLCIGACRNGVIANNASAVGSSGPTADGRIRPDVVAPGEGVTSSVNTSDDAEQSYDGTSMSSPIAAGNALLIRQYFTDGWYPSGAPQNGQKFTPSAALLKAMMINSVETDFAAFTVPAGKIGWGRPMLDNVLYFAGDTRKLAVVDFDEGLETGYQFTGKVNVSNSGEPLRITLNWTDYPGVEYASPALVNDLNLEVVSPSGKTYKGNVFASNVSTEGGSFDTKNPVENVFIDSPETGDWKINVKANNVPKGPQPFALVVSGVLNALITSASITSTEVNDDGQANPDGNMDPGENVVLYVSIKNASSIPLTGLQATLSSTSPGITVTDNTAAYGTINADAIAKGDGFKVSIASSATIGSFAEFNLSITSTELSGELGSFELMIGTPRYDYVNHDVGNVKLTVAKQGAVGFLGDEPNDKGDGFRYPKTALSSWLYHASFAAGTSASYINDRFYGDDNNYTNAKDWKVTTDPDGKVTIGRHDYSDQDSKAIFDDSGNPAKKGLKVTQYGYAWKDKEYVFLKYVLENTSSSALNGMYAGIIADFDMGLRSDSNKVGTNQTLNLAYVKQASTDNPHCGVKLLKGTKANVSALENPVYVYQGQDHVWNESNCFKFIKGDISVPTSSGITDWSVAVSAGPFNLAAGSTDTVAFAFIAGDNLADIQANATDAQTVWNGLDFFAVSEDPLRPEPLDLAFSNDLLSGQGSIYFSIPAASRVRLEVYDLSGRYVNTLVNEDLAAGQHKTYWNGKDASGSKIASGVYFIVLNTPAGTVAGKAVILK